MMSILLTALLAAADRPIPPGVPEVLARERAGTLRDVRYELAFVIPADRRPVLGRVVVHVTLKAPHPILLDFEQPRDRVESVRAYGRDIDFSLEMAIWSFRPPQHVRERTPSRCSSPQVMRH